MPVFSARPSAPEPAASGLRPPGALAPILETRALVVETEGQHLIDAIDLGIHPGRRTVIMGPNGAGKSLLLRLLHGLLEPTRGRVLHCGRPLEPADRLRQAMVFQRPVMLRRTALGNLLHALRARGISGADGRARAERALQRAGLGAQGRTPARLLSGGEQQRLALVRALALEPEILFLDEPCASLDPASTLEIEALVDEAHRAGTTIVLVTHDRGQAKRLADEIVFLHRGRLVEHTAAERFFARPTSTEARAFLDGQIVL